MKILLINTFYYPNMVGGTEQSVKLLAEGLLSKGNEVFVLTGDSNAECIEQENINGVKVIRLNAKSRFDSKFGKVIRKGLEFKNILFKKRIEVLFSEINPDVIHTNNLFYLSNIVWEIAQKKDIRIIHTLRDYWGICPKSTLLNSKSGICQKSNLLCDVHKKNYKCASKFVDLVTAPSKFTLDLYNKNNVYNNTLQKVVYNAIDIDLQEHRKIVNNKLMRRSEKIEFIFLGSLEIHKGIKFMIETFKKIKNDNISLTICGDGSLKKYVIEACKSDKRIRYLGKVGKDEKDKVLKKGDVMIVPSIWYEPFGRVVIEGYKYGMPVIACDIGGISELLNDEVSISIKANNQEELKQAINRLTDRKENCFFVKNTEKYIKKYDLKNQIEKFLEIYNNITNK